MKPTIIEKGKYKNLELKTKYERDTNKNLVIKDGKKVVKVQGIPDGESIVVTKKFTEGKPFKSQFYDNTSYLCGVTYEGQDVSLWLTEMEHNKFSACGGESDKIKITLKNETYINKKTGAEGTSQTLYFEKVE